MGDRRRGWIRIALGAVAGGLVGWGIGQLPMPWPAIILCIGVAAGTVFLVRSARELRQAQRDLDWVWSQIEEEERRRG